MAKTLIEFTDSGQDFLWWVADETGKVIDCGPFQADIWCQFIVTNLATLKVGDVVEYDWQGRPGNLKHLVRSIQSLAPVEVVVRQDSIAGYVTSTVRGKRCSCTHDDKYAVERLAEKLFPGQSTKIERIECTPAGRLHSKWRITVEAA